MKPNSTITGQDFREMFAAATSWLEKSASDIDALNVFPVPDGDTGTNMLLTMRSTIEEAYKVSDDSVSAMAQAMATGALMGARGNSGVILSQIWSGIAKGLLGKDTASGADMAEALTQAADIAYKGLNNPVEGTVLTVIKDASKAARNEVEQNCGDVITVMETAVIAASESVANTPTLLPVLKEAGVVDAGGQGLFTILDGALRYLRGEAEAMQFRKPQLIASKIPLTPRTMTAPESVGEDEVPFGYCTEFLLKGQELDPDKLRKRLKRRGQSLIVVGDQNTIRVHIHTVNPGKIIQLATSLGTVHSVNMRNMDEQHQDFLEMQKARAPVAGVEIVAVVAGEGLSDVFTSLGVAGIVSGGQTMNPSTKDILQVVNRMASSNVIILPNNKNIVMTAEKVGQFSDKNIRVVPSKTVPQGVAAILAFDYEADFDTNVKIMTEALSSVKTIEITRAVRTTKINGLSIKKKQAIGVFDDGEIISVADEPEMALYKALSRISPEKSEVLTIYYGDETGEEQAQKTRDDINERYPNLQVEVVKGASRTIIILFR
jgi:DAK2 domain fusion protein YloV